GRRQIRIPRTKPQDLRELLIWSIEPIPPQEDQAARAEGAASAVHAPLGLSPRQLPLGAHFIPDLEACVLGCTQHLPASITDQLQPNFHSVLEESKRILFHDVLRFTGKQSKS